MKDGIYHVRFAAAGGQAGEGLIVVKGESINGGDAGYLYRGKVTANGDLLAAQIQVTRWEPTQMSVFGVIDSFNLTMTGRRRRVRLKQRALLRHSATGRFRCQVGSWRRPPKSYRPIHPRWSRPCRNCNASRWTSTIARRTGG